MSLPRKTTAQKIRDYFKQAKLGKQLGDRRNGKDRRKSV